MDKHKHIPLKDLQAWMQQVLIDPMGTADKPADDFLPDPFKGAHVEAFIAPNSKLNARQRLAIYQQGYLARLRACMASQFKTLEYALGEELFEQFADMYIQAHPSTHYNLIHLGDQFAEFLQANRPDKGQQEKESWIDFMIELITFEYYINKSFDQIAEAHQPATPTTPDAQLQLNPVLYFFEQQYPVLWFYKSFIHGKKPELPLPQPGYSLILRNNFQLELFPLQQAQYLFLQYIQKNTTLPLAITKFKEDYQLQDAKWEAAWSSWRKHWIQAGVFRLPAPQIPVNS
jgi:hypothetical protein